MINLWSGPLFYLCDFRPAGEKDDLITEWLKNSHTSPNFVSQNEATGSIYTS